MKTHGAVDRRSLALAQAVADVIDRDPSLAGLTRARSTCARWLRDTPSPAIAEWQYILHREWSEIRTILLDPGEQGQRLRQSSPFCGVLSTRERWEIYRRFSDEHQAGMFTQGSPETSLSNKSGATLMSQTWNGDVER